MAEEDGKKEDPFGFTPEGEAPGYIGMDQARLMAMQLARAKPVRRHWFNRLFKGRRMVFSVAEEKDSEDYYTVTLSFRPEGDFGGTPGHERFIFEKTGEVVYRGVEGWPKRKEQRRFQNQRVMGCPVLKKKRRFPLKRIVVALVAIGVGAAAIVVVIGVTRNGEDSGRRGVLDLPFVPSTTRAPTATLLAPTATPAPAKTPTRTTAVKPDKQAVPEAVSTPTVTPSVGSTTRNTPSPTATPETTLMPEPTQPPPTTIKAEITGLTFLGAPGYNLSLEVDSIPGAGSQGEITARVTTPDGVMTEHKAPFTQLSSGVYRLEVIVTGERIPNDENDKLAWARENIDVEILFEPEAGS